LKGVKGEGKVKGTESRRREGREVTSNREGLAFGAQGCTTVQTVQIVQSVQTVQNVQSVQTVHIVQTVQNVHTVQNVQTVQSV